MMPLSVAGSMPIEMLALLCRCMLRLCSSVLLLASKTLQHTRLEVRLGGAVLSVLPMVPVTLLSGPPSV